MKNRFINNSDNRPKSRDWRLVSIFLGTLCAILITMILIHGHVRCRWAIRFINAEIACEEKPAIKKTGYAETQSVIEEYIEEVKKGERASEVSVYFRDLESGPIFGINEFKDFAPASLLKLPLALVYFSEAEKNPEILTHMLILTGTSSAFVKDFKSKHEISPGIPYSVEYLLEAMLSDSDNNAYEMLYRHIEELKGADYIRESYLELGILSPNDPYDKIISVRRYASIFRGLYYGSLTSIENSEKLLRWLNKSEFKYGIVSGVPESIAVSHKYGERRFPEGVLQLHDCGIVYYPKNPYLLCVMTSGKDYENLELVIHDISEMVYREVESRRIR